MNTECLVDGDARGAYATKRMIAIAHDHHGFPLDVADLAIFADPHHELMGELADEAELWMNNNAPPGVLYFWRDGSFFVSNESEYEEDITPPPPPTPAQNIKDRAKVSNKGSVGPYAMIENSVKVKGHARLIHKSRAFGNAIIRDFAVIADNARIGGYAEIGGNARVREDAEVRGPVTIVGEAIVNGHGWVASQTDVAWVDRVGSGEAMTLHKTLTFNEEGTPIQGWQLNAGCKQFNAETRSQIIAQVTDYMEREDVSEWGMISEYQTQTYITQVKAALAYLYSMTCD